MVEHQLVNILKIIRFLENRDYEIRFKIEPNVTNPSVDYNCKNEIRCSI